MTLCPLVVKVSYATPSAKDGAHAEYIATRPGTDLSVTPDSLARMVSRDVSDGATYTRYIAERPGVVADGEAHGLFDEQGVPDLGSVTSELAELTQAPLYRVIVSVNRVDAEELGLDSKAQWERHVRSSVGALSAATGIPRENVRWVAAHHDPAAGHPHVHIMVWDKTDSLAYKRVGPSHGGSDGHIPAPRLKALRGAFTREIYGAVREGVYEAKDRARSEIRTFGTTSLSLAVEERRRIGAGIAIPMVSGLTRDLEALSRTLPGRGRAAYKYVSPETKAAVDRIVDKLMSAGPIAERAAAYADAAVELKRHHTADPDELVSARASAEADLRERLAPEVLQAAVSIQLLRTAEGIVRTAPLVARNHLLAGAPEATRVFYARALRTARIDENTAASVMVKACRGDEPLEATAARIAAVFAEDQPLRPSEWAAWRNENMLPELSAGLQQSTATLHLLEQVSRHLSPQSSPAAQEIARVDWGRLGRATRPKGRTDGGRGMTLDPRDGLSS
jgi:hypothetical protein